MQAMTLKRSIGISDSWLKRLTSIRFTVRSLTLAVAFLISVSGNLQLLLEDRWPNTWLEKSMKSSLESLTMSVRQSYTVTQILVISQHIRP